MKPRLLLCAALLLFVYACEFGVAPGGGGTGGEGLTGIIVDGRGAGVAGAKVRVYPDVATLSKTDGALAARADSTVTDSKGGFRFAKLPDGRYNLEVSITRNDTVYSLMIRSIDFVKKLDLGKDTLQVAGSLRVQVQGEGNVPVGGATCFVPGSSWKAVSNAQGECVITGVAPGEHPVSVVVQNITVVSEKVRVTSGNTSSGGTLYFNATDGGDFIPADWVLTSLQGYSFFRPPQLNLVYEGYGIDTWGASFQSASITLQLGSGMVGPLEQPVTFPEYAEQNRFIDSNGLTQEGAILVTYRVPDTARTYYDADFIAGLQIYSGSIVSFPSSILFFRAACDTRDDQRIATRILKSVRKWKGPGPQPLPPPLKPSLRRPASGITDTSASPLLVWANQSGSTITTHYRVQVALDAGFLNKVSDDSVKIGDVFTDSLVKKVGPLTRGNTYYWRVVAVGPGGMTASEVRTYRVPFASPPIATLSRPLDGEDSLEASNVELVWQSPTAFTQDSFQVQVARDSFFTSASTYLDTLVPGSRTTLMVPYAPAGLQGGGRSMTENGLYYWRVIVFNADGRNVSPARSFRIIPKTPFPRTLSLPAAGATNVSVSPLLSWGLVPDNDFWKYFRIQVSEDNAFTTLVLNDSVSNPKLSTTEAAYAQQAGPLKNNTPYYWRVLAFGSVPEAFSTSLIRSFTTIAATADSVPRLPSLVAPADGYDGPVADSLSFSWMSAASGSTTSYYHLQVGIDSAFVDPDINDTVYAQIRETGLTTVKVRLSRGTGGRSVLAYYWRVIAVGPGGVTSSPIRKLTLGLVL